VQKVVDSNFLQCNELISYLSRSKDNKIVLTDYASMEAYKNNTLISIYKSMTTPCRFPKQVVILKTTGVVCGLSGRASGLRRRLIDERQTRGFSEFCGHLSAAKAGDLFLRNQLLEHGRVATAQMARVLADVPNLPQVFHEMSKSYGGEEISILRHGARLTDTIFQKLINNVLYLAAIFFANHPYVNRRPNFDELINTFIFRFPLCGNLLMLNWVSEGSQMTVRPDKLRNDLVDLNFAVFATFFYGLLSADKKLRGIHKKASDLLAVIAKAWQA